MNREEAKLELDATTLRPQDASPEALAHVAQDAALANHLAARTEFDEKVSTALSMSVPADLRASILQAAAPRTGRVVRWLVPALLSAAACVVIGWALLWPVRDDMPEWQAVSLAEIARVEYGLALVDHHSEDLSVIKTSLAEDQSPVPQRLPDGLKSLPVLACKCIQVNGRRASMICFNLEDGAEAHLIVMDNTGMVELPPEQVPQFLQSKNWSMASWSDGSQSFLLATTGHLKALKKLFG